MSLMQAHADNDEHVKQPKATRKGYMGQLRVLAIALIKSAQSDKFVRGYTEKVPQQRLSAFCILLHLFQQCAAPACRSAWTASLLLGCMCTRKVDAGRDCKQACVSE